MDFKEPEDPRIAAIPDSHGHAKGEHKAFAEERPIPYTARMLFLWFYHACRRGSPRFMMVADHMNYLTFEDPAAVNLVRRALKLAQAGDLYGAAETAGVEVGHAAVVSDGLRKGMRYAIGAEVDNDPRSRPDAQNIVDAMRPDGMIRSVHFLSITHPQHGENWMWAFDNPEFKDLYEIVGTERVWEIYITTLLEAINKLPGNIVGHFYVPAVFGHWPDDSVLQGYEDKLIDACAERGMAIELNSRYLYKHFRGDEAQLEKFRAVHLRLMRKAVAKNVSIAVGSDAHSPKDQGGAFTAVLGLLDEAEINEIAFPLGGRLARVALRATEEIMRQYAPEPEPGPLPGPAVEPETVEAAPAKAPPKRRPTRPKAAVASTGEPPAPREAGELPPSVAAAVHAPPKPRARRPTVKAATDTPAANAPRSAAPNERPASAKGAIAKATAPKLAASKAARPKAAAPKAAAPKAAAPKAATPKATARKAAAAKVTATKARAKPVARKSTKPAAKATLRPKAAGKKTAAKPTPLKKAAAKKPSAKRPATKRAAAAKTPKRSVAKKAVGKRPSLKKTGTKKSTTAKKVAKKASARVAKRAPVRRPASKKSPAKRAGSRPRR